MLTEILIFVDALPPVKHQFQCISHSRYPLCMFPEQYCHSDRFSWGCRPCSKDVCDKLYDDDFPLQCRYNCTVGKYLSLCIHFVKDIVPYYAVIWYIFAFSRFTKLQKMQLSVQH